MAFVLHIYTVCLTKSFYDSKAGPLLIASPQCTAFDLLEKGMEVHIVADAVSARRYRSNEAMFPSLH